MPLRKRPGVHVRGGQDPDDPAGFQRQVPEVADIWESDVVVLGSDLFTGYVRACTAPFSYVLSDSTGSGEHISHEIFVAISVGSSLGGIRISWRRQVSPPPGTPTFGDVPPSDAAFPFIEALVASGITAGCGSGNYCPDNPITRRQMAVFLAKALGLHWPPGLRASAAREAGSGRAEDLRCSANAPSHSAGTSDSSPSRGRANPRPSRSRSRNAYRTSGRPPSEPRADSPSHSKDASRRPDRDPLASCRVRGRAFPSDVPSLVGWPASGPPGV